MGDETRRGPGDLREGDWCGGLPARGEGQRSACCRTYETLAASPHTVVSAAPEVEREKTSPRIDRSLTCLLDVGVGRRPLHGGVSAVEACDGSTPCDGGSLH